MSKYRSHRATIDHAAGCGRDRVDQAERAAARPARSRPSFQHKQQIRGFYDFADPLDIDRYTSTGKELRLRRGGPRARPDGVEATQQNWINLHTVYTHGYGFVAAPATSVQAGRQPVVLSSRTPAARDSSRSTEPRIYYGELSTPTYSIVGAPERARRRRVRPPDDGGDGGQINNTYDGKGGVAIGSFFRQLLSPSSSGSGTSCSRTAVNDNSKILYVRDPRDRVEKAAPFLTLDGDPYPAVVDGRVIWILDGYTTSDGYPYSRAMSLSEARAGLAHHARRAASRRSRTRQSTTSATRSRPTVDAYDGTVTLYSGTRRTRSSRRG